MPLANMEEIYQAHARTVYKFLLSQCHDADLAEELTQETFYQAVRSIDRFNGSCKVSVWLCQIAKHLWYQHLRKRKPEEPLPEDGLPGPPRRRTCSPGRAIWTCCGRSMPCPQHREVVYLRAFGGLSFREIGDVLGRTETWARVTFYRGKEALRKGGADHEEHS
ncbi:MAG: RNA polymerase sigma factor [Dysosmobacter welbionis]